MKKYMHFLFCPDFLFEAGDCLNLCLSCQDFVLFRPAPHDMKQKRKILMQIQIARKQKNKLHILCFIIR